MTVYIEDFEDQIRTKIKLLEGALNSINVGQYLETHPEHGYGARPIGMYKTAVSMVRRAERIEMSYPEFSLREADGK